MPLRDLLGKRVRTASGTEVGAPTVRAFFRALEVFGGEIAAVRLASKQLGGKLTADQAAAPFLVGLEDGRLRYVLEGLFSGDDLTGAGYAVAAQVAPMAWRIDQILGDPDAEVLEDDDVDGGVLYILGIAERLHIDPMAVMDWPLGLFLDAQLAFSRPSGGRTEQSTTRDGFAEMGMPVLTPEQVG